MDIDGAIALGCPSGKDAELGFNGFTEILAINFEGHTPGVPWFHSLFGKWVQETLVWKFHGSMLGAVPSNDWCKIGPLR